MGYSSETNRILMTMYKTGGINKNQFSPSVLHDLFQNDHITNSSDFHDANVYITEKGRAYVEKIRLNDKRYKKEIRRSWTQFWIPVIISLIALFRPEIISFINYLLSLLVKK